MVVVVAVVAAPDDLELELPPLAAMATPVPPRANAVAVASKAACLGRNTCDLPSVVVFLKWNSWLLRAAEDGSKKSVRLLQGA